jgi:hypothetical protein
MRGRAMTLLTLPSIRLLAGAPVLALAFAFLLTGQVRAAGTVGTGTPASCDEAAFDTAFAGGGAVTFDCGTGPVTIIFTGTKTLTADTQIEGEGLITISGGDAVQLFVTTGFDLTLNQVTLRDAFAGSLGRGAAVNATNAIVAVLNSTLVDNVADFQGGAVAIAATDGAEARLIILSSTLANNSTQLAAGGAVYASASGAEAPCPPGGSFISVLFLNSTFTGNSGSGVGQVLFVTTDSEIPCPAEAEAQILYSTLGDDAGGTPTLYFEGNTAATIGASIMGPNAHCGGSIPIKPTSLGYNVASNANCFTATTGDVVADPLVGPLADNGGFTQTRALLAGSPAIDRVPAGILECNGDLAGDQRGEARPQGTSCDSGAYESVVLTDTAMAARDLVTGPAALLLLGLLVAVVGMGWFQARALRN